MEYQELIEELGPQLVGPIAVVIGLVCVLCFVLMIASYIMRSLGLYGMAKARGLKNPGLAWVPVVYVWVVGKIADDHDAKLGMNHKWRHLNLWLMLAGCVIMWGAGIFFTARVERLAEIADYMTEAMLFKSLMSVLLPLYGVSILGALIEAGANVCVLISYYKGFEDSKPSKAPLFIILSVIVPLALPIILLCCRNWVGGVRTGLIAELPPESRERRLEITGIEESCESDYAPEEAEESEKSSETEE